MKQLEAHQRDKPFQSLSRRWTALFPKFKHPKPGERLEPGTQLESPEA
jgi:hypothetical protein